MLSREQVLAAFHRAAVGADVAVVEGVMGLFDGRDGTTEQGSTAQLAKWLGAPVVLVLDASAVARSAAATAKGYIEFDPDLHLAGLLFNKVGGPAHTQWLQDAMGAAGIKAAILGGVPKVRRHSTVAGACRGRCCGWLIAVQLQRLGSPAVTATGVMFLDIIVYAVDTPSPTLWCAFVCCRVMLWWCRSGTWGCICRGTKRFPTI